MPSGFDNLTMDSDEDEHLPPGKHRDEAGFSPAPAEPEERELLMNTTAHIDGISEEDIPLTWAPPTQTRYGLSLPDAEADRPNKTDNALDKQWFFSKAVRTRCYKNGKTAGTQGEFKMTEGLDPAKANVYFELLMCLKEKVFHPTACTLRDTDVRRAIQLYQSLPKVSIRGFPESLIIQHYLEGKRQESDISLYFNIRQYGLMALPSGCMNDNVFTAASSFIVGDASNAIPLRVEIAVHLLRNRTRFLEYHSQDDYADSLVECMSPKGVTNACLLQGLSDVCACNISVFAYSLYMGDVHTSLADLADVYKPHGELATCQHLQHMALYAVPIQSSPLTYFTYSVVSCEDVNRVSTVLDEACNSPRQSEESTGGHLLFYDIIWPEVCAEGHTDHPIQKRLERVLRYSVKGKAVPFMCPLNTSVVPRNVLLREEDDANRPIRGPGIFPNEFWTHAYDETADRGYFRDEGYWAHKFVGFRACLKFLERFMDEHGEPDLYPLYPHASDVFVCAIDDARQTRHAGFSECHAQTEYYHPDT